ncbi:MAG TPA: hypothetical protein VGH33_13980 [Isosphaeraceae bacterium]
MSDESDEPAGHRGGPNGQFTVFDLMVLLLVAMAIILPARDGYRDGGLPGLLTGLAGGIFLLAPLALVLGTAAMAALIAVIVVSIRLFDRVTGGKAVPPDVPCPPQSGDRDS